MSSFDAIFLHGVMDYSRGAKPMPAIPDFKDLQKRLSGVQRCADLDDVVDDVKGIASDFDFDDEIEQYVEKSYDKIDLLHRGIRDACASLNQEWDPDNMTRDEMIAFVEKLQGNLEENLPSSKTMKDVAHAWFGYQVGTFIHNYHALKFMPISYHTDDMYHGYLRDDAMGRLSIKACSNGILRFDSEWKPGHMVFTSDNKIVLSSKDPSRQKSGAFVMPVADFMSHFENWAEPLEEEIALFDVVHPGADWTVLRYLRDYQENNYVSNKPKTGADIRNFISVAL
jgi:hypothetical protein